MLAFGRSKDKQIEVQRLLTKIMNANCRAVDALREGPRGECRMDLSLVVIVAPKSKGRPQIEQAFATVTREVSSTGMALVVSERCAAEEVFLALQIDGEMKYVRGEVKHQDPLGAGLWQVGVQLTGLACDGDYPELTELVI